MVAATKAEKRTVREVAGDLLLEKRKQLGDEAAKRLERPTGARALTKAEQRAAFWKRFATPEQEAAMLADGQSPMAVSAVVYKRRWELWNDAGPELSDKLAWAKEMAKLGPPEGDAPAPATAETEAGYAEP